MGIVYDRPRTLSFEDNLNFMIQRGFARLDCSAAALETDVFNFWENSRGGGGGAISFGIDVSAMDRTVMACVVCASFRAMRSGDSLCLLYTPGKYRKPSLNLLPIRSIGPAHPALAPVVSEPNNDRALIMGLGYEYGLALSVIDSHDPDQTFIFCPIGADDEYLESVRVANFDFDFGQRNYELIEYHLSDLTGLYDALSSLSYGMRPSTSMLCLPLGPKIFSAICIVVAFLNSPDISVVRYSLASTGEYQDVDEDGQIVELQLTNIASDSVCAHPRGCALSLEAQ